MRHRIPDHRHKLPADRVHHLKEPLGRCFICGAPAMHRVVETPGPLPAIFTLDLCTYHFARMFKMKANRFPKKIKSKQTVEALNALKAIQSKTFVLRRHMDTPMIMMGDRLISHHFTTPRCQWFCALYRTVSGKMIVTSARVFNKELAVNIVEDVLGTDFIEASKRMLHAQGIVFKIDEYELPGVTSGFTDFFEKAARYADII